MKAGRLWVWKTALWAAALCSLKQVKTKVGDWIHRMKNGHLPAKWAWVT